MAHRDTCFLNCIKGSWICRKASCFFHLAGDLILKKKIWMFPKIGVPPKHPKMIILSRKTHGCWVPLFFGNTHIYMYISRWKMCLKMYNFHSSFTWNDEANLPKMSKKGAWTQHPVPHRHVTPRMLHPVKGSHTFPSDLQIYVKLS